MKLSRRELVLSAATGIAVLIGVSYWFAKPRMETWAELADNRQAIERRIELFDRIIGQKGQWEDRLTTLRTRLSRYSADKDATADYLRILERTADSNKVKLVRRRSRKETSHGDLYELGIDCTWEADLGSLLRFLNALEEEDVTMDIADLTIAIVSGNKEQLKGDFTLICVYTRDAEPQTPNDAAEEPPPGQEIGGNSDVGVSPATLSRRNGRFQCEELRLFTSISGARLARLRGTISKMMIPGSWPLAFHL